MFTPNEGDVGRLLVLAAAFEAVYRAGPEAIPPFLRAGGDQPNLSDLLTRVPDIVIDDFCALVSLASTRDFARLREDSHDDQVVPGPVLAGAALVSEADADFVVRRNLFDVKTTVHPRRFGREEVMQLLGYVLLDIDDDLGLQSVGWYFSRQGLLLRVSLIWFLDRCGSQVPLSLDCGPN